MSMHRSCSAALVLLAAAGVYGVDAAWAGNGQTGKFHPWVLIALFWGVALVTVVVHHICIYVARVSTTLEQSWHNHVTQRPAPWPRATLSFALASAATLAKRHLARGQERLATVPTALHRGWNVVRHACGQRAAGARRAPGALIGWSRTALKALRA